jgi:hypothetical protein
MIQQSFSGFKDSIIGGQYNLSGHDDYNVSFVDIPFLNGVGCHQVTLFVVPERSCGDQDTG